MDVVGCEPPCIQAQAYHPSAGSLRQLKGMARMPLQWQKEAVTTRGTLEHQGAHIGIQGRLTHRRLKSIAMPSIPCVCLDSCDSL